MSNNKPSPVNLPNAITLGGYGLGFWWIAGGPSWAAIVSILADEIDGAVARKLDQTSEVGRELDWGADVALASLTLLRLGAPAWAAALALGGQAVLHAEGSRPPVGSLRAVLMVVTMVKEAREKKARALLPRK